jgi:hypothetical protein
MFQDDRDARRRAGAPRLLLRLKRGAAAARYIHGDVFNFREIMAGTDQSAKLAVQMCESALLADAVHENDADAFAARGAGAMLRPRWRPILRIYRRRVD